MTHRRRTLPAAALALGLAAALTGCSSTGTQASSGGAGAGSTTSASATPSTSTSSSADAGSSSVKVGDVVDFAAVAKRAAEQSKAKGSAHLTADMGSTMALEADIDVAKNNIRQKITMGAQSLDLLVVDKVVYIGGALAKTFGVRTPWMQIDPKGTDPVSQRLAPVVDSLRTTATDPTAALSALSDVRGTVTATSASATTYKVTLTPAQVAELAKQQPQASAIAKQSVSYDYTVDASGLPQKVQVNIATQSITLTFSDWGKPADITAPPASEVTLSSKVTKAA